MTGKKIILSTIFFFMTFFINSEIPETLKGTWTRSDRIIFLEDSNNISVILKEYYGWYYDRAVEPEEFSELKKRDRNAASSKKAYQYEVNFNPVYENVWEMEITIDKKTKSIIPVALINNKLYLTFLVKVPYDQNQDLDTDEELNDNPFFGYWQGVNTNDSIRICPRNDIPNIISWYITENGIYRLRFWKTKMINEDSKAVFSDNNKLFVINKHIFSAGTNYSCVNGRSSNIRNVEKYSEFPFEYTINSSGTIMALGKPYLIKVEDKNTAEEIIKITEEANSQRKPAPPSLFPVKLPEKPGK